MKKSTDVITEERARRILAMAMEIESKKFTTVQELESIAREVGISADSFHAALKRDSEVTEEDNDERYSWAPKATVAGGVFLGVAAGILLTTMNHFAVGLPLLGIMSTGLAASAGLIALERRSPTPARFVLRNTLLWGGVAGGSMIVIALVGSQSLIDVPWLYSLPLSLRNWFFSATFGAVAVSAMQSKTRSATSGDDSDAGNNEKPGLLGRVARSFRAAVDAFVQRLRILGATNIVTATQR